MNFVENFILKDFPNFTWDIPTRQKLQKWKTLVTYYPYFSYFKLFTESQYTDVRDDPGSP